MRAVAPGVRRTANPPSARGFRDLAALGRIESERLADGKPAAEVHYVALSRRLSPKRLLEVMHAHWSMENHLHWPQLAYRQGEGAMAP
jgi:predicted transposase YbfD/YdcC